jgi:hypothetical protein
MFEFQKHSKFERSSDLIFLEKLENFMYDRNSKKTDWQNRNNRQKTRKIEEESEENWKNQTLPRISPPCAERRIAPAVSGE